MVLGKLVIYTTEDENKGHALFFIDENVPKYQDTGIEDNIDSDIIGKTVYLVFREFNDMADGWFDNNYFHKLFFLESDAQKIINEFDNTEYPIKEKLYYLKTIVEKFTHTKYKEYFTDP